MAQYEISIPKFSSKTKFQIMKLIEILVLICCLVASSLAEGETCASFGEGGNVYPHTTFGFGKGHELYYSKVQISKPAPPFTASGISSGQVREFKLSDYLGKYLVIVFYPQDFTFVCPTEILAFNDRLEEFRSIDTEVVAMSVDAHFVHLAWTQTPREQGGLGDVKLPLLSDPTHQISKVGL